MKRRFIYQAATLGDTELLGLSPKQVKKSAKVLSDFLENLLAAIEKPSEDPTIAFLVSCLRDGPKPIEDWKEDLRKLLVAINSGKFEDPNIVTSIESLLMLLSGDYSEGVRAIYYR